MFKSITYLVVFMLGMFLGSLKDPEIRIVKETKIKYKVLKRTYEQPREVLIEDLKCYDLGIPRLSGTLTENVFNVKSGLCNREWEKDFTLDAGESSNWKYYVGIGATALVVGGLVGLTF